MTRITHKQQQAKHDSYRQMVEKWFTPARWEQVYTILSNESDKGISCRLLEFLVTQYAHDHSVEYYIESPNGNRRIFNMYTSLQSHQQVKRKKYIEPFARSNKDVKGDGRFEFGYGKKKVTTSVAQLMFFRWALENQVLQWIEKHKEEILAAKSEYETENRSRKRKKQHNEEKEVQKAHNETFEQRKRRKSIKQTRERNKRRKYRHSKKQAGFYSVGRVSGIEVKL